MPGLKKRLPNSIRICKPGKAGLGHGDNGQTQKGGGGLGGRREQAPGGKRGKLVVLREIEKNTFGGIAGKIRLGSGRGETCPGEVKTTKPFSWGDLTKRIQRGGNQKKGERPRQERKGERGRRSRSGVHIWQRTQTSLAGKNGST